MQLVRPKYPTKYHSRNCDVHIIIYADPNLNLSVCKKNPPMLHIHGLVRCLVRGYRLVQVHSYYEIMINFLGLPTPSQFYDAEFFLMLLLECKREIERM